MKRNTLTLRGVTYNLNFTLGTALDFKQLTGEDIAEQKTIGISTMAALLYCICKADAEDNKKEFAYQNEREFAKEISLKTMKEISIDGLSDLIEGV